MVPLCPVAPLPVPARVPKAGLSKSLVGQMSGWRSHRAPAPLPASAATREPHGAAPQGVQRCPLAPAWHGTRCGGHREAGRAEAWECRGWPRPHVPRASPSGGKQGPGSRRVPSACCCYSSHRSSLRGRWKIGHSSNEAAGAARPLVGAGFTRRQLHIRGPAGPRIRGQPPLPLCWAWEACLWLRLRRSLLDPLTVGHAVTGSSSYPLPEMSLDACIQHRAHVPRKGPGPPTARLRLHLCGGVASISGHREQGGQEEAPLQGRMDRSPSLPQAVWPWARVQPL